MVRAFTAGEIGEPPSLFIFRRKDSERGQSIVEFALVVPLLLLLVVAIADFGRLYSAMVSVEAAVREAADYGAFKSSYWLVDNSVTPATNNPPITTAEMERRACTAASGSHLQDYTEPGGTVNHATCSNPTFACTLELPDGSTQTCGTYPGGVCGVAATDPPCIVHASLTYTFRTFLSLPPLPSTVTFTRDSRFAVSDFSTP